MTNWKLDDNRSVTNLLLSETGINVVILYQDDIQRAIISQKLKEKLKEEGNVPSALWSIKLLNQNVIRFVPIQRAQIELRGYTISLLLFPSSIEYNVRQRITRELYPQFIRSGGITGIIQI